MQAKVQLMLKFQHYNTFLKAMNIKIVMAKHWRKKTLEKCVVQANHACDEVVMSLSEVYYFIRKKSIISHKFASLCELFVSCKKIVSS